MFEFKTFRLILSGTLLLLTFGCNKLNRNAQEIPSPSDNISPISSPQFTSNSPENSPVEVPPQRSEEVSPETSEQKTLKIEIWQYLYDNREKFSVCGSKDFFNENFYDFKDYPDLYKIDREKHLVVLLCYKSFYRPSYQYFIYHEDSTNSERVTPLLLEKIRVSGNTDDNGEIEKTLVSSIAGFPSYDPERQTLLISIQYRGGSCGAFHRYKLEENRWELIEFREKECKPQNVRVMPPEEFPLIYPQIESAAETLQKEDKVPQINLEIFEYLYDNRQELDTCEGDPSYYSFDYYPLVYEIADEQYLVEQVCQGGKLHNRVEYFLYRPGEGKPQVRRLSFDRFIPNKSRHFVRESFRSIFGVTQYDSEQRILTVFTRFLRSGPCGSFARYKLENSQFELLEYRREACRTHDIRILPPDRYPLIYP